MNCMFVLRPTKKTYKVVCPTCAARGEITDTFSTCKGTAIKKCCSTQYYVQDRPIQIVRTDRDPKTGILRYWEGSSEYFYETTYPTLNRYVPEVPYGIHLCHDDRKSAEAECERINKYLHEKSLEEKETNTTQFSF